MSGELGLSCLLLLPRVSILHVLTVCCFVESIFDGAWGTKSQRVGGRDVPEHAGKEGAQECWMAWK